MSNLENNSVSSLVPSTRNDKTNNDPESEFFGMIKNNGNLEDFPIVGLPKEDGNLEHFPIIGAPKGPGNVEVPRGGTGEKIPNQYIITFQDSEQSTSEIAKMLEKEFGIELRYIYSGDEKSGFRGIAANLSKEVLGQIKEKYGDLIKDTEQDQKTGIL